MTEIDYEAATLAVRHAGLWIAGAHVVVGLLQAGVVAFGIRAMLRANAERAVAVAVADATAAARREADQRHAEAMQASAERHAEMMAALKTQSASLAALIEGQARTNETLAANTATLAEATAALKIVVERAESGAGR